MKNSDKGPRDTGDGEDRLPKPNKWFDYSIGLIVILFLALTGFLILNGEKL